MHATDFVIRDGEASDAVQIADILSYTRRVDMPYLPLLHSKAEDLVFIRDRVLATSRIWVAVHENVIVGFCAVRDEWIEHLYVRPGFQGKAIGSRLLTVAKQSKMYLQLWVFQENHRARQFYERHGFQLAELTDGATNEEHEPGARYVWSPQ